MKNYIYLLLVVFLFSGNSFGQNTSDKFLELACDFFEYDSAHPNSFFVRSIRPSQLYPPVMGGTVDDCRVIGISNDGETALVSRRLYDGKASQEQILHVNKQSNRKVLYVFGRSSYIRPRFTSGSTGEGGSRGGTSLPSSTDTLDFNKLRVLYQPSVLGLPGHFQINIVENRKFQQGDASIGTPVDGSDRYNRFYQVGFAVTDCGGGSTIFSDGTIDQYQIRGCHPGRR